MIYNNISLCIINTKKIISQIIISQCNELSQNINESVSYTFSVHTAILWTTVVHWPGLQYTVHSKYDNSFMNSHLLYTVCLSSFIISHMPEKIILNIFAILQYSLQSLECISLQPYSSDEAICKKIYLKFLQSYCRMHWITENVFMTHFHNLFKSRYVRSHTSTAKSQNFPLEVHRGRDLIIKLSLFFHWHWISTPKRQPLHHYHTWLIHDIDHKHNQCRSFFTT